MWSTGNLYILWINLGRKFTISHLNVYNRWLFLAINPCRASQKTSLSTQMSSPNVVIRSTQRHGVAMWWNTAQEVVIPSRKYPERAVLPSPKPIIRGTVPKYIFRNRISYMNCSSGNNPIFKTVDWTCRLLKLNSSSSCSALLPLRPRCIKI